MRSRGRGHGAGFICPPPRGPFPARGSGSAARVEAARLGRARGTQAEIQDTSISAGILPCLMSQTWCHRLLPGY